MKKTLFIFLFVQAFAGAYSQQPTVDAAQIANELQKLNVLDRVLYIAAHPDDENTRLIAWVENYKHGRAAYLSLTRGDGGQNLIGDEKGDLLGIIRTQELLRARAIDGGEQYFTRAIDFGYSKSADETFKHWPKDSVLSDIVRVIRQFKPDIIITRFPPDERAGHGHHTASALLAIEAFAAAASPDFFPETANKYGTWKTDAIYWNHSPWWDKDIEKHKDDFTIIDVGVWNPLLGESITEIAALSRSQHQSQGFGMAMQRGEREEYLSLDFMAGFTPGILAGYSKSWFLLEGGNEIALKIKNITDNYDASYPSASVEDLMDLYFALKRMPDNRYKSQKMADVKNLIVACGGLWMECTATQPYLVSGQEFEFKTQIISQSRYPFKLKSIKLADQSFTPETQLLGNTFIEWKGKVKAPEQLTIPYWLQQPKEGDLYSVTDRNMIGVPENEPVMNALFVINTPYGYIEYNRPVVYKWTDRVKGELYRPVSIVPEVSVQFEDKVQVGMESAVRVNVMSNGTAKTDELTVKLILPKGWTSVPEDVVIADLPAGGERWVNFKLKAKTPGVEKIGAEVLLDGNSYQRQLIEINPGHIPAQVTQPLATMRVMNTPILVSQQKIGYIPGSGDDVPQALRAMGYKVDILEVSDLSARLLDAYDVIITGIRAYNVLPELAVVQDELNAYVKRGGTMVVQYNTNRGLVTEKFAPYKIHLSRGRVTEEDAPVSFLVRSHPVLMYPNQITPADFDGWVQERGLYFADEWDSHFNPILAWNDFGDKKKLSGSLLIASYGQGTFVYTGISFFRQLPAGVPGAYKLFSNIISIGHDQ